MSIILETIKKLEKKYKNLPSYLSKDEVIKLINKKPSFFGRGVTMWNCTDLGGEYSTLFGFKSGIIIDEEKIKIINTSKLKKGLLGNFKRLELYSAITEDISYYGIEELCKGSNEIYDGEYLNRRERTSINKEMREWKYTERIYLDNNDFYILNSEKGKRTNTKIDWGRKQIKPGYFKFSKEAKEISYSWRQKDTYLGKYEEDEIEFFLELNNLLEEAEEK